jgi:DNA-binding CsgD family transcriptional regulator
MLVGRKAERGRIDALLADTAEGRGGALVLRGEPGIGKSALLRYARDRAQGMLVLTTSGVESEVDLPFAGLHELLQPLLGRLETIPEPQAAALSGALALGPPVPADRFAVSTATLSLLAAQGAEQPSLVLVDDVPWLDAASGEVLRFVLRRLQGGGIAALAAVREGESSALDGAGLPELWLAGLELSDAQALVPDLAPDVAAALVEETRGNPLALEEIPALLTQAQASGAAPLPDPLPASAAIVRAFERRLEALPKATARALVVAAASGRDRLDVVGRALGFLDLDAASLEVAEEAGILRVEAGWIIWRHPLLRSTAYHSVSSFEQRRAHAALAEALPADEIAARAWQLAAAASGRSEGVAVELERAARDALGRQGLDAAARAFERAAELTPGADDRARRVLEAAQCYRLVGRFDRARALVDEATRTTRDALLVADAALQRGVIEIWGGDTTKAVAMLVGETEHIQPLDRDRAVALLLEAGLATQMSGVVPNILAIGRRAENVAAGASPPVRRKAADFLLGAQILSGNAPPPDALGARLRERVMAMHSSPDETLSIAVHVGHMLTWVEEHDVARQVFEGMLAEAEAAGALGPIPYFAACLCELEFRDGRFETARSAGANAVRVAEETDQVSVLSFALVCLARVEAALGRTGGCRARTQRALEVAEAVGAGSIRVYGLSVLGFLELGLGRLPEALLALDSLSELVGEIGLRNPNVVQWRSDHIEALVLAGRPEDALASLAVLEEEAARTGCAWPQGVAARARGMLADASFEPCFEEALRNLAAFPYERARTELRLGERLRRERRPLEAREPLRSALAEFERFGAVPWAERARTELAATGARPSIRRPPGQVALTPQELRIARLVAEGATNKEAAAQLFLSPKTVGYHLAKVYAKLGIHSRAELVRLFVLHDPADGDGRTHAPQPEAEPASHRSR